MTSNDLNSLIRIESGVRFKFEQGRMGLSLKVRVRMIFHFKERLQTDYSANFYGDRYLAAHF